MESGLSCTMALSMKVNLGNYESADAFVSLSGITQETTGEEMDELLTGPGKIAYEKLRAELRRRIDAARGQGASR